MSLPKIIYRDFMKLTNLGLIRDIKKLGNTGYFMINKEKANTNFNFFQA